MVATFVIQEWRAEWERGEVLLRRYLAQLQDAGESWASTRRRPRLDARLASRRPSLVACARGAGAVSLRYRWLTDLPSKSPLTALLGALAGVLVGALVMFFEWAAGPPWSHDAFDSADASAFVGQGETVLWLALLCGQTGLWLLLLYPSYSLASELHRRGAASFTGTWLGLLLMVAIAGGFIAVASSAHGVHAFPGYLPKFIILTALGFTTCALAVVGLWRIRGALGESLTDGDNAQVGDNAAKDLLVHLGKFDPSADQNPMGGLLRLHDLMHRALLVLGAVLAAGILATGALRNALIAWDNRYAETVLDDAFPLEHLLAYGTFFSMLLGLIYVPVYTYYQRVGRQLLHRYIKLPYPTAPNWSTAIQQHTQLRELLHLDVTPTANFQAGVAILAPLTSSLLAVLLPTA